MSDLNGEFDLILTTRSDGKKDFSIVDGDECFRQQLAIDMRIFYREWALDRSKGIAYKSILGNPRITTAEIRQIFFSYLKSLPYVDTIQSLAIAKNNRIMTVTYTVNSIAGVATI